MKYKILRPKEELWGHRVLMAVMVVGAMVLISISGWYTPIQNTLLTASAPFLRVTSRVVSVALLPVKGVFSGANSQDKIRQLSAEASILQARIAELEYVEKENEALKNILENSDRTLDEMYIASPILSLSYPAIGVGEREGVLPQQAVVLSATLIGTISEVYPTQSKVSLLSSQTASPLLVRTETGIEGIIIGDGKNVIMRHIPREIQVKEGERVFTIGQEGIRKNMFVGRVSQVVAEPSSPTQEATISQYVSFYDAVLVEVWQ